MRKGVVLGGFLMGVALGRAGAPAPIRQAVADFTERYVLQDRCPANDQLEAIT